MVWKGLRLSLEEKRNGISVDVVTEEVLVKPGKKTNGRRN